MIPKIKICGMREEANIADIAALRPDYMGFIFYERSPRFAGGMNPETLDALSPETKRAGVFVHATEREILEQAEKYALDLIQLHGDETPEFCRKLHEKIPVIKAFGIADKHDLLKTLDYAGCCDYFLFDTKTPLRGGSGQSFDHSVLSGYTGDTPWFLSGGIGADFRSETGTIPFALDLNSRFEAAPGIKDANRLKTFMSEIKTKYKQP